LATFLTPYGGTGKTFNHNGGNQLLLEDDDTRIFLDFGSRVAESEFYFNQSFQPRPNRGLLDYLSFNLLPPLEGLYRDDLSVPSLWEKFREHEHYRLLARKGRPPVDAVLLTQSHIGHGGFIPFLHQSVPIYSSVMTGFLNKITQDISLQEVQNELVYMTPHQIDSRGLFAPKDGLKAQRQYAFLQGQGDVTPSKQAITFWNSIPGMQEGELVKTELLGDTNLAGSLPVHIYPIDHSVVGASAYSIQTSAGWVVYIGDIRRGGQMAGITEEFIDKVSKLKPIALVTEGTRAGLDDKDELESHLRDRALEIVADCDSYVIADFGKFNFERIRAFWEIAQLTKRRLVITMEDAYFIEAVHHAWFTGPRVRDIDDIVVYDAGNQESVWENQIREELSEKIVTAIDVKRNSRDYILGFGLSESHNFTDLEPWHGVYLRMSHNDDTNVGESRLNSEQMDRWLLRFDMTKIDLGTSLASVHSSGDELIDMVRHINPRYLVPVHTSHPEYFLEKLRGSSIDVNIPVYGSSLNLE